MKMTKKEYFEVLRGMVEGNDELVAFIDREVELLTRKSGVKTKTQIANEGLVEDIYNTLVGIGKAVTIKELQDANEAFADYSGQKMSAMLKKLVDTDRVIKSMDKKKAYFLAK